jgi:DNA polymerase III subunit delta'
MLFKNIIGNEETKSKLITAINNGHIAHALLFSGNEGSANLALALAFITYLNCENRLEDDSCGVCPSCHKSLKLIHPDVKFSFPFITFKDKDPISDNLLGEWRNFVLQDPFNNATGWSTYFGGEDKQLYISVDESRQIIRKLTLKPFEAMLNVMLIWLPEYMNSSAANALLKEIEEPPDNSIFILVTNDIKRLIPTILSRTQVIQIQPFTDEELIRILVEKHFIEKDNAGKIAHLVNGNINEALRLAREVEYNSHVMFRDWMRLCYQEDLIQLMQFTEKYQSLGKVSQQTLLLYGLSMLRESLVWNLDQSQLTRVMGEELDFVKKFSVIIDPGTIEKLALLISEASYHLERNANVKILFIDLSLRVSEIFSTMKTAKKSI